MQEARAGTNGGVSSEVMERLRLLQQENEQLQIALSSRIIIEQAKGAISARCGVTTDEAFELLRGLARSQRREIRDYATQVVANGGRLDIDQRLRG